MNIMDNMMYILVSVFVILLGVLIFLLIKRRKKRSSRRDGTMVKRKKKKKLNKKEMVKEAEKELIKEQHVPRATVNTTPKNVPKSFEYPQSDSESSMIDELHSKLKQRTDELLGMIGEESTSIKERLRHIKQQKVEIIKYADNLKEQWVLLDNEEKKYEDALKSLTERKKMLK